MGLDSFSSASVSTPLDPNVLFSKVDCPPVVDAEIKERVLRAHGKLIHMAIWARPDLAHCVSVLGRYVHNPSQKHLDAYLRVARYLIKTKDLRIVYGTHDHQGPTGWYFTVFRIPTGAPTRTATAALAPTSSSWTAQPVHGRSNSAALRS